MDFKEIFDQYWVIALTTFILSFILTLIAVNVFPKIKLMDRPQQYGLKRKPIPYYGGLVIFIAFVLSVLIFIPINLSLVALLLGGLVIFVLGFFDDLLGLSPLVRIIIQFLACLILVVLGVGILSINLPFIGNIDFTAILWKGIPIIGAIFTIVWVMVILNTMNLIDGIGGLSSGVTFIAGMTLFALSIHPGIHEDPQSQVGVAMLSLIIAMVALGFFIFDFPKPKILMGDSGSTFLGFVIAALAIFSGGKVATAFLVLGIPILDMIWVIIRRIFSGQKFWLSDYKHLHHRLLDLGISEKKVVLMYLFVTALLGISAVMFVNTQQKFYIIIGLMILMVLLASALVFVPKKK